MASSQQQPLYTTTTSSPQEQQRSAEMSFNAKVSPSILLIIVILAVIFFVSGLLHLLVRFLLRPPSHRRRDHSGAGDATALQGELRQLFHLHDAGVDQSFIDALPVFLYKSVISNSKPAAAASHLDCAVCLCEFDPDDRLRLLPRCSHAFHADCIDTWLLSHSTCPLCRACLLLPPSSSADRRPSSPLLLVLESSADSADSTDTCPPPPPPPPPPLEDEEKVVTVKLGKFKSVDPTAPGGEGTSSAGSTSGDIGADSRRCFSMGSFAYVVDESSELRVPIRATPAKKKNDKASNNKAKNARAAISECDCESRREFEFESSKPEIGDETAGRSVDRSRRAVSFRFLRNVHVDSKGKSSGRFPRRTVSEIGVARRENRESGIGFAARGGEESSDDRSFNSLDSQLNNNNNNPPSFARKTLLWLMGGRQLQQNKVVHSSFDPPNNV